MAQVPPSGRIHLRAAEFAADGILSAIAIDPGARRHGIRVLSCRCGDQRLGLHAGIGLAPKIKAYKLQEQGYDTVEANKKLGFDMDLREYGLGAQILTDLGLKTIRLLTNNPKKVVGLEGYGLQIVEQVPIQVKPNPHNASYLKTKRDKLGHLL